MIVLGVGMLAWYYAQAIARPGEARRSAQAASQERARSEMRLPALGRVDAPLHPASAAIPPLAPAVTPSLPDAPLAPYGSGGSGTCRDDGRCAVAAIPEAAPTYDAHAAPAQAAPPHRDRRLSGPAFARAANDALPNAYPTALAGQGSAAATLGPPAALEGASPGRESDLAEHLRATTSASVQARLLPTRRLLLPKGAFIDCTLETAIDSTLPGMTTCVTASDTFGADGNVVLLERGTKLVGETRGRVQQGAARVFVLWTEARTPTGVAVPLDSPGTDELGRSGLPGDVERHFWERFGAAMLVSMIDGAVQAAVQSASDGRGTVIYSPSAPRDVLAEVLRGTIAIPPTVVKRHGERIQVLVARDLDFRPVYELQSP
jgi:type IV secretion system protein VirB10